MLSEHEGKDWDGPYKQFWDENGEWIIGTKIMEERPMIWMEYGRYAFFANVEIINGRCIFDWHTIDCRETLENKVKAVVNRQSNKIIQNFNELRRIS